MVLVWLVFGFVVLLHTADRRRTNDFEKASPLSRYKSSDLHLGSRNFDPPLKAQHHPALILCLSLNGFAAVLLGALGAHAWHETLLARGTLASWQVATQYHLVHAAATLGLLAWHTGDDPARAGAARRIAWLWQIGCLLFAGSIYALSLGGPRFLGPVTPLGGLAFMAGWALLGLEAFRKNKRQPDSP
jgi:uncharacterized membrane protein YgdD (TMEM256/DUF423 family)